MKKIYFFVISVFFILLVYNVNAQSSDVNTVIKKSEKALEAMMAGSRKMEILTKDGEQVTRKFVARRAHKVFPDGKRDLMVILEPEILKGTAYMYWDLNDKPLVQWVYPTAVRRVRKIDNTTVYESFLGTDFTYSDIDIADAAGEHKLLGEEEYNNKKVYKVETIPKQKWYYSRIVSLIASDTFLPIKRDYYDSEGRHWKTKLFENVTVINNVPIPLRIRMLDAQRKGYSTEAIFSEICHDVAFLTKEDFDPTKLSEAALSPVCSVRPFKQKEEPGS